MTQHANITLNTNTYTADRWRRIDHSRLALCSSATLWCACCSWLTHYCSVHRRTRQLAVSSFHATAITCACRWGILSIGNCKCLTGYQWRPGFLTGGRKCLTGWKWWLCLPRLDSCTCLIRWQWRRGIPIGVSKWLVCWVWQPCLETLRNCGACSAWHVTLQWRGASGDQVTSRTRCRVQLRHRCCCWCWAHRCRCRHWAALTDGSCGQWQARGTATAAAAIHNTHTWLSSHTVTKTCTYSSPYHSAGLELSYPKGVLVHVHI